jgi:hypothetical protein
MRPRFSLPVGIALLLVMTPVMAHADVATTTPPTVNCTFTQGYWKNHSGNWPVTSLTLGNVTYSREDLIQILNTPVRGNGLIDLAHQLISVKLNVSQGADGSVLGTSIADADALIGNLVLIPPGNAFLSPSVTSAMTDKLDKYNNGLTGPGHCGNTATLTSTWGALKSIYR